MYYLCIRFTSAGQTLQINLNDETTKRGKDIQLGSPYYYRRERDSRVAYIRADSYDLARSCS